MGRKIVEHVTVRGKTYVKKGTCVICGGDVLQERSGAPCGQQVRPEHYRCKKCGLSGSSHLWDDAWAAHKYRQELIELNSAFSTFTIAVEKEVLKLLGLDRRTKNERVNYYWRKDVDAIVDRLRKLLNL